MIERVFSRVLLPFAASWVTSPTVERVFQSEVEGGVTGAESRGALRQVPQVGVAWSILPTTTEQRSRLDEILRTALREGQAATPFWGRGLKVASGSSGTTLELAAAVPDAWVPVAGAVLWIPRESDGPFAEEYEITTVASATGHTLTLDDALTADVPEGSLVWPVIAGRFTGGEYEAVHGAVGVFKFAVRANDSRTAMPYSRTVGPDPSDLDTPDPYEKPATVGGSVSFDATTSDETVAGTLLIPTPQADGEMVVTVSGGSAPYTVSVTGQSDQTGSGPDFTFTGLSGGDYTVTVTDDNGASDTGTVHVYVESYEAGQVVASSGFNFLSVSTTQTNTIPGIPKFDSTLGTLLGVTFGYSDGVSTNTAFTFDPDISTTNTAGSTRTIRTEFSQAANLVWAGSGIHPFSHSKNSTNSIVGGGFASPNNTGVVTFAPGDVAELTSSLTLASVTGTGDVTGLQLESIVPTVTLVITSGAPTPAPTWAYTANRPQIYGTVYVLYRYEVPRA